MLTVQATEHMDASKRMTPPALPLVTGDKKKRKGSDLSKKEKAGNETEENRRETCPFTADEMPRG